MKTIVSLLILLTLFSVSTFAADSPRQKAILKGERWDRVKGVMFSPDGSALASAGWGNAVYLWDVASGKQKTVFTGHTESAVETVALSPDGSTLASAGWGKKIYLWDVASGQQKTVLTGHTDHVLSVAFSPDSSMLASGSRDKTVRLWDVASGQLKALLIGDIDEWNEYVYSVAFSPDGGTLASAGAWSDIIRLWDVASGKEKRILTGHKSGVFSVVFSPDGNTLVSGCEDKTVRLWDVASGQQRSVLTAHTGSVLSVAFSPDGNTFASASRDKTVRLWDVVSQKQKAVLPGHTNEVDSVAFSPDGGTLASASHSNIHLWDLTASTTTSAIVRISPASIPSPSVGEQFTVSLKIVGGENVIGYQATVVFDSTALRYFSRAVGDYLSDSFLVTPVVDEGYVTVASTGLVGSNGDGVLGTITFQVVDVKTSALTLSQVTFVDPNGERSFPHIENGIVTERSTAVHSPEDVNIDGVVNIQDLVVVATNFGEIGENKADINGDGVVDIVDLVKVATAFRNAANAPSFHPQTLAMLTAADVQSWLIQAQGLALTDGALQRGILLLEHLLAALTPNETVLLPNYPNPFNPETWIPYQLAKDTDVTLTIYAVNGQMVRTLPLGHQPAGIYHTRNRAAYWDGRNAVGEPVASGIYFYTLTADDFTATRRMLILK